MAKKLRDPGAPKRNVSAYLLFQNAMRNQFKAQNPGMTFGQLAKYTSAMYSELTPVEKNVWAEQADADKIRYEQELTTYAPPPGFDSQGNSMDPNHKGVKRHSSSKTDRDINAPKRNLSAYLLYQNAMRDSFKAENPGMTFGQLAKYTSHMFKNMLPEERAIWDARAQSDRERFLAEMSGYVPPPGHDERGNLMDGIVQARKRNRKLPRDANAPKRARGSFVFFTLEARPRIIKEFPGIKFIDIGHVMGQQWRALPAEDKKKYEAMAEQDKVRFNDEMQKYQAIGGGMEPAVVPSSATSSEQVPGMPQMKQEAQPYYDLGNSINSTNNFQC